MLAQILLIQCECRAAIQLEKNISFRPGHQPFRTKGVPTAQRTEANLQPVSIHADGRNGALLRNLAPEYQCFTEARAITGQTSCDGDALGQVLQQATNQVTAIDI